jgi:iron complex outermembrane receptor protein
VSSLPTLHGLADDRLRIKVDGMDLISACGNHMNPALSYIDPTQVGSIQVFTGITPVSAGGDAIGGSILVGSQAPEFAAPGQDLLTKGSLGAFYRSNGNGRGANASATVATQNFSLRYNAASAESGNYEAAQAFKSAIKAPAGVLIPGPKEVGSSEFRSRNQGLDLAVRGGDHLLELKLGRQDIPYQGFPNQRMDMTRNTSDQVNLRYLGQTAWGSVEARLYQENTRHTMNFLHNKLSSLSSLGMPMDTEGKNSGAVVKADVVLSPGDTLKLGAEWQRYRMSDVGPPQQSGHMRPQPFWNTACRRTRRRVCRGRAGAPVRPGVRSASVTMDTGKVQGYNTMAAWLWRPANPSSILVPSTR